MPSPIARQQAVTLSEKIRPVVVWGRCGGNGECSPPFGNKWVRKAIVTKCHMSWGGGGSTWGTIFMVRMPTRHWHGQGGGSNVMSQSVYASTTRMGGVSRTEGRHTFKFSTGVCRTGSPKNNGSWLPPRPSAPFTTAGNGHRFSPPNGHRNASCATINGNAEPAKDHGKAPSPHPPARRMPQTARQHAGVWW